MVALVVLPLLLAGVMALCDRLLARARPAHRTTPVTWLLVLSAVSIATHPVLDFLNTYGVRFLMPFSGRWFYGDSLFVVDLWVWGVLATGVIWSRRRERRGRPAHGPAQVALGLVTAYALSMALVSQQVSSVVAGRVSVESGLTLLEIMAAPVPVTPVYREVLVQTPDAYRRGVVRVWPRAELMINRGVFARSQDHPAAVAAAQTEDGRRFLSWSRFPYFQIDSSAGGRYRVRLMDARYNMEWASATVDVGRDGDRVTRDE